MHRRAFLTSTAVAAAVTAAGGPAAFAQSSWPTKPVRLLVSFPAGGATDLVARPWADALSKAFGDQFAHGRLRALCRGTAGAVRYVDR